jgi:hypothetical protein
MYWQHLCDQVVKKKLEKKRQVKMVNVHPYLKLEAYRDPSLLFTTPREINCLCSCSGNMIGFGMCDAPLLEEKYKDLCENDTCCLVLCSEMYGRVPEKLHLVGIGLSFDGISIGIRVVYHRRHYILDSARMTLW